MIYLEKRISKMKLYGLTVVGQMCQAPFKECMTIFFTMGDPQILYSMNKGLNYLKAEKEILSK